MPVKKVLLTVTTYPLPSRSYDELVCTAGVLENGEWIRIYPMPLSFLKGLKKEGKVKQTKYTWIELDLKKRTDDFRPESYSPKDYEFQDLAVGETLDTKQNWQLRKNYCLNNVYTNMNTLIEESKAPQNKSLATFKPAKIHRLLIEKDESEWKPVWQALQNQMDLFADEKQTPEKAFPKVPYKFKYEFEDETGKKRNLMIEDWEIGQLYWNCLKNSNNDETIALEKVRQQYETNFINNKDIYLFLGTTKEWHTRRSKNPFVIIGVFYPKKDIQTKLF
ncbi:hypothetical protein [Psychroflexus salis]|uniref:Uncharacterized protein n=1 Tax=Psychroflexus salis TaxID=1526574 RepID=A0A917E8M1_9FLAO|nr:hypothetical protein [Psychroflexus salis]GGE14000.1 hypothetical protein GCM10010831_14190 [Psychroflexus salis]